MGVGNGAWNGMCLYGDANETNRVMFEYQLFNLLYIATIGLIFFFQQNLHKFYLPLYRLVNLSILLQLVSALLYFLEYPYHENRGNCIEIFVGELCTISITFAEFHQLYVVASILGLGKHNFPIFGSLNSMLKSLTMVTVASSFICMLMFGRDPSLVDHSSLLEEFWTVVAAALQVYCIHLSRKRHSRAVDEWADSTLVSPTDSDVGLFEKLSICQLVPALFTLLNSASAIYLGFPLVSNLGSVPMLLDACGNVFFYLKVFIINERSNLTVELVEA